jgi:hypothetical protein
MRTTVRFSARTVHQGRRKVRRGADSGEGRGYEPAARPSPQVIVHFGLSIAPYKAELSTQQRLMHVYSSCACYDRV